MEDHHHLVRPLLLLPTTTTAVTSATVATDITNTSNTFVVDGTSDSNQNDHQDINSTKSSISSNSNSNSNILLRLLFVMGVGILSLWANQEASKDFEIHIENCAPSNTVASRRFQLMYVSNDRATRLVLSTSKFVEAILYYTISSSIGQPNKKEVNRLTLRLAGRNLTHTVTVDSFGELHEFVINLSPSLLESETNFDRAMLRAVQRGMAEVWLHDNNAPKSLVNGMVEYVSGLAGLGAMEGIFGNRDLAEPSHSCWMDEDPVAVAHFLSYCEEKRRGFIQRLNLAMKSRWNDRTVDDALEMPAQHLCGSYMSQKHLPVD